VYFTSAQARAEHLEALSAWRERFGALGVDAPLPTTIAQVRGVHRVMCEHTLSDVICVRDVYARSCLMSAAVRDCVQPTLCGRVCRD
jgi:hypothetical protein